jgi:hypothetical protein
MTDWAGTLQHRAANPDPISLHCAIKAQIVQEVAEYIKNLQDENTRLKKSLATSLGSLSVRKTDRNDMLEFRWRVTYTVLSESKNPKAIFELAVEEAYEHFQEFIKEQQPRTMNAIDFAAPIKESRNRNISPEYKTWT